MHSTWSDQVLAVLRKDVLLEARSKASLNAMVFFAALVLLIFSFALGPNVGRLQTAAPGILWLAFLFAGVLAFARAYQMEQENNAFEGLLLLARSRSAIYVGKLLGATLVMLLVEVITFPVMSIFYNLNLWTAVPPLLFIGILGTVGFASVGAIYGALTMTLRAREVLLPLLLLPIAVPVILASVKATSLVFAGHGDYHLWLELLVAFDIIFITAGILTFEHLFEG